MGALTSLIILCVIAIGSLLVANIINRHERKLATKRHYQLTMRQRAEELEELVKLVDPVLSDRNIAMEINNIVIDKFRQIQEIEPSDDTQQALENAIARSNELSSSPPDRHITYVAGSDAQIALQQKKLNAAGRVLNRLKDKGKITETQHKNYTADLRWSYLQVEVMTYMHHGYKSRRRDDMLTATAFFKKAADVLRTSGISDDRKNVQIREVSEIIRGQRKKLSHQTNEDALLAEDESETVDDTEENSTDSLMSILDHLEPGMMQEKRAH